MPSADRTGGLACVAASLFGLLLIVVVFTQGYAAVATQNARTHAPPPPPRAGTGVSPRRALRQIPLERDLAPGRPALAPGTVEPPTRGQGVREGGSATLTREARRRRRTRWTVRGATSTEFPAPRSRLGGRSCVTPSWGDRTRTERGSCRPRCGPRGVAHKPLERKTQTNASKRLTSPFVCAHASPRSSPRVPGAGVRAQARRMLAGRPPRRLARPQRLLQSPTAREAKGAGSRPCGAGPVVTGANSGVGYETARVSAGGRQGGHPRVSRPRRRRRGGARHPGRGRG